MDQQRPTSYWDNHPRFQEQPGVEPGQAESQRSLTAHETIVMVRTIGGFGPAYSIDDDRGQRIGEIMS